MSIRGLLCIFCILFVISVSCGAYVSENYASAGDTQPMAMASSTSYLTIDPDDYNFLIYNCGGEEASIVGAMEELGINNYTERNAANPVTADDLATHDILITSWNSSGNSSGLDPDILYDGIIGRIILTGHDSDYHTAMDTEESKILFSQMIDYVLTSSYNTGLIGLADHASIFDWLPSEWNVSPTDNSGEWISEFTPEGLESGIYDGLTPEDMSNWSTSYHNTFTNIDAAFSPFELGGNNGEEVITIANVSDHNIDFEKTDNVNDDPNFVTCVLPEEQITYTICWANTGSETFYNVTIVDRLPDGVDYEFVDEQFNIDPNYNIAEHTYTWDIDTLTPDDSGCVTLTVDVNYNNTPGMPLHNLVYLMSDTSTLAFADEYTPVCCFGDDIVYVDQFATGLNTGVSWTNAYTDLQSALDRISETGCGDKIWVAGGIYSPGDDATDTFDVPDDVYVYGGLAGNETSTYDPNERDMIRYLSILTGNGVNDDVVTMGDGAKLHGFTVEEADRYGVYSRQNDFSIYRSIVQNCGERGIYCSPYGNLEVHWCTIKNNTEDGIYHSGNGKFLLVSNSRIHDNGENGIYAYNSTAVLRNSNIHHNGWANVNNYNNGIRINSYKSNSIIRNCTVFRNNKYGIYYSDSFGIDDKPEIYNCIFYNNNYHGELVQFLGGLTTHYSSVTDPADPNSSDCTEYGDHNIKCDPKFAYIDINDRNLHLASDSPCIDAGYDDDVHSKEVDIDGEARIYDTDVDMGSDEVSCTDDIANTSDFSGDGQVNNLEFAMFSKAWLQYDPEEYPEKGSSETINWNPQCDLLTFEKVKERACISR